MLPMSDWSRWSRWSWWPRNRALGSEADRATFRTLHTASQAAPALRAGLTATSAQKSSGYLRALLGTPALALTSTVASLAWDGYGDHHADQTTLLATRAVEEGATFVVSRKDLPCPKAACPIRSGAVAPLVVDEKVVGTLQVFTGFTDAGLVRATEEVAAWVSSQLELAELDVSRSRLMEAEVRALRAQISPHFIYNSLTTIASFTRTDPDRARELLLDFADFTRYSFRRYGPSTTLAEELRSIERYVVLEQARFGDRLQVVLQVAPEVLSVPIPFLCLQPLVENAVRHGLEGRPEGGTIQLIARDAGQECVITIEDDGIGVEPEQIRNVLSGEPASDSVGLGNVDERLRATFGDDFGLVVETAPAAGTKVTVRIPKFAPGVQP